MLPHALEMSSPATKRYPCCIPWSRYRSLSHGLQQRSRSEYGIHSTGQIAAQECREEFVCSALQSHWPIVLCRYTVGDSGRLPNQPCAGFRASYLDFGEEQ